jgi:uncharacterized protein YigE (DUF2233 family)
MISCGETGCPVRPRRFIALCPLLLGLCAFITEGPATAGELTWDRLQDGLEFVVWNPEARCEEKVPALLVLKIDPERFRFSTYYFQDEGMAAPPAIQEWQHRTGASVVFNAGLFRADYSYLGLLRKEGRWLGAKPHPRWQGLFVAEPVGAQTRLPKARVVDLGTEPALGQNLPYREAAQSIMLLDRTGNPRVRHSGKRAHQTVVGEDQGGRILIIKTTEAVALWELAVCLRGGPLGIALAMAMDGGASSDVLVQDSLLQNLQTEAIEEWRSVVDGSGQSHIPLPSVIGVFARK